MMTDGQTDSIVQVLRQLSEILDTDEGEPTTALRKMADLVRDHTQSHGAKVFVVKRTPGGPGIEQLCRTDLDTLKRKTLLLSKERGLADWVVHNNDWLIIPDAPGSEDDAEESIVEVITGKHGYQELVPRKEKEYYVKEPLAQEPPKDDERTMLWVPIYSQGKPAGALAVWRKEIPSSECEPPPYEEADANSLHQIVPYIGFAVRRLLHLETLQRELEAVSSFAKALHSADSLEDAYRAVAHGVGELAIASHVILLYHDPDRPGYVYQRAVWSADEHSKAAVCSAFEDFYTQADVKNPEWTAMVSQEIDVRLHRAGVADFHCRRLLTLMNEEKTAPTVTAAFIDRVLADNHPEFFANDLLEHSADSFFRSAGSLLPDHIQTFSHKIADRIGGTDESPLLQPDRVLKRSAKLLKEATNASAVLLYAGPPDEMKVVHCTPEVSDLIGYSTKNPSLTLDSIQTLRRRRVVNVEDNREEFHGLINDQSLKHIRCTYGWKTAKSWLGCPIIHNQRCIAFIAVLTADSGTFLGKDHERIAEIVCDRTSWEFQKANRRYMLEKLNELAKDLTACSRDDLKIKMVELLQQWANRFVKPHSDIVVIARSTLENMPEKMLLKAASPGFDHRQLDLLSNLSKVWQHEERDWPVKAVFPNHGAERRKDTLNLAGIAVPVSLPKKARLQGHLCMLNRQPFHEDERQAARDAAREIAVILYTLQLDTEWRLASGRLRHMLLGPVQGLSSAALFLAELAKESHRHSDVVKARARAIEEIEAIRHWRQIQRLYMGVVPEIRTRHHTLRPLFQRCVERFRPNIEQRNISLHEDWRPRGELQFEFDKEAVDMMLSNLIDNAVKYAYWNREITVGAASEGKSVKIWVEDIGHPIPKRIEEQIYQEQWHIDWDDPFRIIEGEGIGLPMAKAVVQAHGGKLYHSCEPAGTSTEGDKAPFRVRFTVELPTHWRKP